jgi:CheY-like chemotaxis protein
MGTERGVVLVVEHDPELRDGIGAWLEAEGHEVMACPGPSAPDYGCVGERRGSCPLATAADAVVLDLWLAGDRELVGTGAMELLARYLTLGRPVVALAARAEDDAVSRLFADDPVAVVEWPPERHELCETVEAVLLDRSARPDNERR